MVFWPRRKRERETKTKLIDLRNNLIPLELRFTLSGMIERQWILARRYCDFQEKTHEELSSRTYVCYSRIDPYRARIKRAGNLGIARPLVFFVHHALKCLAEINYWQLLPGFFPPWTCGMPSGFPHQSGSTNENLANRSAN